jgi:hypothetical protein
MNYGQAEVLFLYHCSGVSCSKVPHVYLQSLCPFASLFEYNRATLYIIYYFTTLDATLPIAGIN